MSHSSGLPEPFHPSPEEQQKYDKSTIKTLRRVTGEIDNDHVEDESGPAPKPQTLDLDQVPTDLYSRPQRQESPSSTKAQHGLGSKRRSRSSSQRETIDISSTQAQHSNQTQEFDPEEAMAYSERKFELGDDPRLVLTDAIMTLMELQMKIGKLHAEAYDELEECLKRVIRISRRRSSVGRGSTD